MEKSGASERIAAQVTVTGTVQGVGFRPFVYNLAEELNLAGSVRNAGGVVEIELYGPSERIDRFVDGLRKKCPPLADIDRIEVDRHEVSELPPINFVIMESIDAPEGVLKVPPDVAVCTDCLSEVNDTRDRRYLYPFTNCTNCGPRFTVIASLPYDRAATTLKCFPMCETCSAEYYDPRNRRFHAQPNACWECGPQLAFVRTAEEQPQWGAGLSVSARRLLAVQSIDATIEALRSGDIVAIKGLGGFHLACDAESQQAVARLRHRKRRNGKPFGVMFQSIEQVEEYCRLNEAERQLLGGVRKPLVLLEAKQWTALAPDIAEGLGCMAAMLPYTPLQMILLERFGKPLVMTSGNVHEEPIAIGNREALDELAEIADAFLLNNRDIHCRFDDSLARVVAGAPTIVRRARGYAPEAIAVPVHAPSTVLALGGHLKNTFCFLKGEQAYLSQHIGDTNNIDTLVFFQDAIEHYQTLFAVKPQALVCDLHPDYQTTQLGERWSLRDELPLLKVQHHHAHIAACMAEHGLTEPVIGVAMDGIGFGDDGTAWGGEFLLCDLKGYKRVGRLSQIPMPGGELAIRQPWRMATAFLDALGNEQMLNLIAERVGSDYVETVRSQIQANFNSPLTSSCGRLFDAASSILKLCDSASFEAQAAMLLESLAMEMEHRNSSKTEEAWPHRLITDGELLVIDSVSIIGELATRVSERGGSPASLARAFHLTLAKAITDMCLRLTAEYGVSTVCLSGGVFQNKLLTELTLDSMFAVGLDARIPRKAPANDGGLSLGQAVVAASMLANER